MNPKAKTTMTSAAVVLTACAALTFGYPMISATLSAQPVKPDATPAPVPSAQPAEKPAEKPATPAPAPAADEKDKGAKPEEKPADKPGEKPGDKPADKVDEKPAGAAADKPAGSPPAPAATTTEPAKPKDPPKPKEPPRDKATGRVIQPDELTTLAFKNVTVDQMIPFIVEATGKVVIPRPDLLPRKITIINDQPIKRSRALELVFYALQQEGIGVIETNDLIIMRNIAEIAQGDVPVIGPDVDLSGRDDWGRIVEKVFAPNHASAQHIVEALEEAKTLPDYAKMTLDPDSNQLAIMGNIGLLQRVEALINSLDRPSAESLQTETFHLRYADAEKISANIKELFGPPTNAGANNQQNQQQYWRGYGEQNQSKGRGKRSEGGSAATSLNLRATPNTQQNSVTVLAEQTVLDQIADAIEHEWDLPLPEETVIPKVYQLINTDPLKIKAVLDNLFSGGKATPAATGNAGGGGGGGGGRNFGGFGGGGNTGADATSNTSQGAGRLAGQYAIEALTDSGRLVVIAKSPDNLAFIDKIIEGLDQPKTTGLPVIIELKHASAEELAEQLNALLAQEGTLAAINRQETGLTDSASNASPFAADATTGANGATTPTTTTNSNQLQFWWQRARPPTDNAGTSNIVSKVRIVPVWRQNALMIMSPPEYQKSLAELIESLDRPGRQVLIAGIVVEISLDDSTALGLRWSNSGITPTNGDNVIGVGNTITGQKNNLINSLFDTSVLNTTANLNLILQALAQKTSTNILSEPRIFTSDNQEAQFFDGQDIPFVDQLQNTNNGQPTQSFTYRAVGIRLNVRPRITVKKDVDLRINLELASISPGQTVQNALIVDRRETTTHLIVKDGQTVVLSGIMRSETSNITRKVPLLGDLPFVGALFTSIETSKTNTELIAFITPVVVENTDDADALYEQDRDRLEEMKKQFGEKGASIPVLPKRSDSPAAPGAAPSGKDAPVIPPPAGVPAEPTPGVPSGATPAQAPTPGAGSGPTTGHVPDPISDVVIGALDMEGASLEWNARKAAASNPTLDAATRQRLLAEAEKCKQRVIATAGSSAAPPATPVPSAPAAMTDSEIGSLTSDQAIREWTARKKAAAKPGLDDATRQRLLDEAEKCKAQIAAAR